MSVGPPGLDLSRRRAGGSAAGRPAELRKTGRVALTRAVPASVGGSQAYLPQLQILPPGWAAEDGSRRPDKGCPRFR
ncbi:hypothetical protein NDU88_007592 [Pleurodeles waltl]|uniref:Uncharacterized protein n=1 Tax=Pleurodeles waltl TaxID=8319 RepID=A0AAV7NTI2_PLEWA|nr:hypothetical protein NDU88_007592 [Pleurodeles waltl]